jgi:hypothetical protein
MFKWISSGHRFSVLIAAGHRPGNHLFLWRGGQASGYPSRLSQV